ncbi:MAG: hypothetical protein E7459_09275 [Ruminococcaceae bacterium]|nr:hypothetical protein [Oscillospiraceae bacterium]
MAISKKLSSHDLAHKWLGTDETILWEGKPKHCVFLHRYDIWVGTILGIFCLDLGIYTFLVSFSVFFFFPFLLLGLVWAVIPNILRYRKLHRSYYLVTSKRLILVVDGNLEYLEYQNIPYLEQSKRHLGVTTLYLHPEETPDITPMYDYRLFARLFWCIYSSPSQEIWETGRSALVNLSDADLEKASAIINRQLYGHKSN